MQIIQGILLEPVGCLVGRPKLPKGDAKGRIVPIRFNAQDIKRIEAAAKASEQTVSEWIRRTVNAAV